MRVYLSGVRTWYSYFMRGLPRDGSVPLPEDAPSLVYSFPSFWEQYSRAGKVSSLHIQPAVSVILDCGAHSLFSINGVSAHNRESRRSGPIDVSAYFTQYLAFVEKNWDSLSFFVELDIGELVGMDRVRRMRRRIKERGLSSKCLYGWHPPNGLRDYLWMVDNAESRYVGIQGPRPRLPVLEYGPFVSKAYDAGCRLHGFAITNTDLLQRYPFYSVDSTRWLTTVQYMRHTEFVDGKFVNPFVGVRSPWVKAKPSLAGGLSAQDRLRQTIQAARDAERFFTDYWRAREVDWQARLKLAGVVE